MRSSVGRSMHRGQKRWTNKSRRRRRSLSAYELLEPRLALAAQFLISEFMASNTAGIVDSEGHFSEWIEVQNVGDTAGNLMGYYLTDNPNDLENWDFPSTPIPAGGFVRVFASGKDRAVAGQELHTDFALEKNGGYLALVKPDGSEIVHKYDLYPPQLDNISYGVLEQGSTDNLVTTGANVKWHVPTGEVAGWTTQGFSDASWTSTAYGPSRTIVVTEIATGFNGVGTNEYFEIQNVANQPVDTSGWVVAISENATEINAGIKWQALPPLFTPGQVLYRTDVVGDNYFDASINWGSGAGGRGWVMILDNEGQVVDLLIWGWSSAQIAAMAPTVNDFTLTTQQIAAAWNGNGEAANGSNTNSLQRTGNSDGDNESNWSWVVTQSKGSANVGLVTLFPNVNQPARTGVGYERATGYGQYINANTEAAMFGTSATAYMRIPFDVDLEAGQTIDFERLDLILRYDDGFVAYVNGTEVARRNAPGIPGTPPAFNADATSAREGATETIVESIDLSSFIPLLQPSGNVLAIHGLNDTTNDTDFLILPELVGIEQTLFTENYFTTSTPGAANVPGTLGFVADTKFSVDRGFFETPFQLSITSATPGAEIRYTLDGTVPTATTGFVYSGPIPISNTSLVRAAAFKSGFTPTNSDTHSYIKLSSVIQQNGVGLPAFTTWGHAGPDWEMDPDVVTNAAYSSTIINDLKSIPTMSLVMPWNDWFGPSGIYIAGSGIERAASAELINPDGSEGFQINSAVEVQGGSSDDRWKDDKLSLQVKFKSAYGPPELEYDLFGGDAVDRFDTFILDSVLNFSWLHWQDGSQRENAKYIQDQFVADLQQAAGGVAPHGNFVHLYLNGLYWGMYYLHERPDENFAAAYLGGNDEDYDILKHTSNTVVAGSNVNYQALLGLVAADLTNSTNYQAVLNKLDIVPFVDYMIVNFYAGNTDWAHHNWYASYNRVVPGSKWHFHSWDAEHVLKHHLATTDSTGKNDPGSPTAIHQRLTTNPEYRLLFADRVHKHFYNGGVMSPAKAAAAYQARMMQVDRAIVGESARWGDNGRATLPYTRNTDWLPDNEAVRTGYFPGRTDIVKNQLLARGLYTSVLPPSFNQHGGTINPPFGLTMSGVGSIYYTTDGSDPRLPGGAISPTAQLYSGAVTLNGSTRVRARVLSGGVNWSALNEALFLLPTQPLRIAELNYAPVDPPPGSPYPAGDFEFIELVNMGTSTINLNGFQISSGVNYTFGNQSLAAGQRIVVAKNVAAFQSRYGTSVNLANGVFTGSLNNAGEELVLRGSFGETIQSFAYDNGNGWPGRADGKGSSLEIIDPLGDETSSANWRNSTEYNGTPSAAGVGPIDSVVVNEVLTHTDPPMLDAIELYNPTAAPIDIGGWYLSDSDNNLAKYRIANGTVIAAGGYLVFDESQFGVGANGFRLDSSNGDDVYLVSANPATAALQNFIDHIDFPAAANGESFGRWPNGAGKPYPMQSRSFGSANTGPRIGPVIISEMMYNPLGGNDDLEYIELLNDTDAPINLNGWKFDEGADFTFGNTTIQPHSTLVVVRFDPAAPANAAKLNTFLTTYGLTGPASLVGGYGGATGGGVLDNGGEEVRIVRPDAPEPGGFIPYLLVDEVDFEDVAPWPTSPDGTGPSLTRLSQTIYGHEPTNWSGQLASPGSFPILPAPAGFNAVTTAANGISLSWQDVNGELGYKLDRSTDGVNWSEIASLPEDSAGYNDLNLQSSLTYRYRVRAHNALGEGPWSNVVQATTLQLTAITGAVGNDTYHVVRSGTLLQVFENIAPVGQPTYSSELAAMTGTLTIDAGDGNDSLTVNAGGQASLGLTQLNYSAGSGANSLVLEQGAARIESTATGGTLNSTVQAGAQLTTSRLNQNGLTVSGNGRVTLLAGGQTSVLTTLDLSPTGTLDLADNDLVIQSTAAAKPALLSAVSGWLDFGFADGLWNGPGIISSTAATNPIGDTGLSLVDNGLLGLAQFGGVTVDENALVLKYTYYGDIDLNGQVDGEDLTVFALNFGRPAGATQVDGDIDFNGRVDGEDLTVFANNFGKGIGAPLAAAPNDELRITKYEGNAAAAAEGVVPAGSVAPAGRPELAAVDAPGATADLPSSAAAKHEVQSTKYEAAASDDALVVLLAESIAARADSLADPRLATGRKVSADALWAEANW